MTFEALKTGNVLKGSNVLKILLVKKYLWLKPVYNAFGNLPARLKTELVSGLPGINQITELCLNFIKVSDFRYN